MSGMSAGVGERFEKLVEIMRALRAPDGCPWDREQTHASLRPFLLEETYEALEAIDSGSPMHLCEELGDVLFEVVFMSRISEEAGEFTIADTIDAISDKLVRRHPHVFKRNEEATPIESAGQVKVRWEEIKAQERSNAPAAKTKTLLSGLAPTLPALLRAFHIGTRVASVGFDWARTEDVVDKIQEEVDELRDAIGDRDRAEEEMGDLLFSIANLARKLGIEPETALRKANDKFTKRFTTMEQQTAAEGRTLSAMTLDELEQEWQRVKARGQDGEGARTAESS
jgi:MazG family protein